MQNCNGWCPALVLVFVALTLPATVFGQAQPQPAPAGQPVPASQPATASQPAPTNPPAAGASNDVPGVPLPPGFVIGVDDVLTIRFWADTQLSGDALVRTDGRITLPLLGDVVAIGLSPEQLGEVLEKAASKFITDPDATVIVKEIRSRKVFVLGQGIARSGVVPLNSDMNMLQLIATSGGLLEYADKENIVIIRTENGRERRIKFNYNDVVRGKNVQQNILLQPNDTILVN
jgi:polysaccharide export outer membrane protein